MSAIMPNELQPAPIGGSARVLLELLDH